MPNGYLAFPRSYNITMSFLLNFFITYASHGQIRLVMFFTLVDTLLPTTSQITHFLKWIQQILLNSRSCILYSFSYKYSTSHIKLVSLERTGMNLIKVHFSWAKCNVVSRGSVDGVAGDGDVRLQCPKDSRGTPGPLQHALGNWAARNEGGRLLVLLREH